MAEIVIVAAVPLNGVIGVSKFNEMPWRLGEYANDEFYSKILKKADMDHFKEITGSFPVIMGKNTYLSIDKRWRPLKRRENNIVSSTMPYEEGIKIHHSLDEALYHTKQSEQVTLMGGEGIYREGMKDADRLEITRILEEFKGDVFFPAIDEKIWKLYIRQKFERFSFETYLRK